MSQSFNSNGYTGSIAAPINVVSITGTNNGASTVYVMMFDSASTPVNGATPNIATIIEVPAGEPFSWDLKPERPIQKGFYWVASSSQPTLTIATGATLNVDVGY
jgi:hypothetical protein